jgi:adenylate kinase
MATEKRRTTRPEDTQHRGIIFVGAPGSGKGTQSSLLAAQLGAACISTGIILREEARRNTPAGFRLRQTMAAGVLVDDEVVCQTVVSRILEARSSGVGFILDGFPRTVGQARCLDELLDALGLPGPLVLHLEVPRHVLLRRLALRRQCARCGAIYNLGSGVPAGSRCGVDGGALVERDDDSEGVAARRIETYETETLPVIAYYRNHEHHKGIYRRIDGSLGAEEIAKDVCDIVEFADTALAA